MIAFYRRHGLLAERPGLPDRPHARRRLGLLHVSPALLLLGVLPHAVPELIALFLPLAAWIIASRRGEWEQLLAATFVTVAVAVPVLVAAAFVEVYVSPHLFVSLTHIQPPCATQKVGSSPSTSAAHGFRSHPLLCIVVGKRSKGDPMAGTLNEVTDTNFQAEVIESDGPVLVDFWAPWCGPCRVVAPVLEEIASERPDLRIVKLNIDENQQTAANFQVLSIPTLILFKGGQPVKTVIGAYPKKKLEQELEPALSVLRGSAEADGQGLAVERICSE